MNVHSTSITHRGIRIDHQDLDKLLRRVIYPAYLQSYRELFVMIVSVRGEDHVSEAYEQGGQPWVSLALAYDALAGHPPEEVTVRCKQALIEYLYSLEGLPVRAEAS